MVLDRAIRLLEIADAYDMRIWLAIGGCLEGAAQTQLGQVELGLAAVRAGVSAYADLRSPPIFWPMLQFLDAGASGAAGRPDAGLVSIERAIALVGGSGPASGFMLLPEFELLRGDLLAALDRREEAVAAHRTALEAARRLGVSMSALRALTRLAASTEGDERTTMLDGLRAARAGVHEGAQTADLREAHAVLAAAR
jgi:hypothetical protein